MQQITLERIMELDFKCNEAYKSLRTNIQFCGNNVKVICFTSCLPNEGKSNVSFNLAVSFSESGKKVAFIDADLRRSTIIGRYKPDQAVHGLTHYLSGQKEINEIIYETNIPNLDIVFTGPVPPNPSELLSSDYFIDILSILRDEYDYVVIDTPPLGSVTDSAIVSRYCDGTILVIEANSTSYKYAQKVKRQLEQVNSKILGAVLNKENKSDVYKHYKKKYKKYEKNYYASYE
ncbi:MAG: CpsD/CapB family tyrosine-protein kinase [Mobilitalea sp.]